LKILAVPVTFLCLIARCCIVKYTGSMTRIAIVGAGNVGSALARLWSEAGHEVSVAVREGSSPKSIPGVRTGPAKEIAGKAEIVLLAVPWPVIKDALASCGDLDGKIIVDCTNPVLPTLEGLEFGGTDSAGEQLQRLAPRARFVKAFNTIGAPLLGNATFGGLQADGYFCGDDAAAKSAVAPLIAAAGLRPFDAGPLRNARYLEAMAMLWIDLAIQRGRGPTFGFRTLERATT
jgi:8-hydroxy-5-deazaflavin:NADPH oxidoreductase